MEAVVVRTPRLPLSASPRRPRSSRASRATFNDPAAAWPATVRAELPGRTTLLAALIVAAVLLGALVVLIAWAVGRTRGAGRARRPSARDGPVLATSVKGDLTHDTLGARVQQGDVRLFDPTGSTGLPSASWSPVAASASWEGARRTAAMPMGVGERGGHSPDEAFWRPAAARYLAPLLLAARHERATMGDVLSWIATTEQQRPRDVLEACELAGAAAALDALQSVWEADDRFRSSVLQTAATALDAWQEPRIAAATAPAGAIDADWLLSGRNTLYLTAPAHDQREVPVELVWNCLAKAAGILMFGLRSRPPASMSRTRVAGSSVSRPARTHPADPAPTTM